MDHIPPFGGNPTDNYVDRNVALGVPGSKVPAKFFNDMLAEILNVIDQAGLTPDENDLTQLYQAIAVLAAGGDMFKADNLSGLASLTAALTNLGIFQPRGTSIAAAATTEIGNADSFYIRVTGNTGIASLGTGTARKWVWVEFTGTPLLTHSADLDLIGDANIQVRTGDRALFIQTDADSWSMIFYQRNDGTALKGYAGSAEVEEFSAISLPSSADIPKDDSVPLVTEGVEVLSLSYAAKRVGNKVFLDFTLPVSANGAANVGVTVYAGSTCIAALYDDVRQNLTGSVVSGRVKHEPASTAAITYSIRIGVSAANGLLNGRGGSRIFGGASRASLSITEINP